MTKKKLLQKPTNLRDYSCHLVINSQHFTKLEISPYYEKHNQEYLTALKKKRIKLTPGQLASKLITDDLIQEFAKKLQNRRHFPEGRYYQYTYYSFQVYRGNKAYKLV